MPKTKITKNEADIALRAYQIWEEEGKPTDKSFEHWLRAEAELTQPKKTPAKKAAPKAKPAAKPKATAKPKAAPKTKA